jgi:hypothetical protein
MSLQTDLEAQLNAINAAITTQISGGIVPNWSVGSVRFDQNTSLKTLYEIRDSTIEQLRKIPSESIAVMQDGVDAFGHDWGEKVGDDF